MVHPMLDFFRHQGFQRTQIERNSLVVMIFQFCEHARGKCDREGVLIYLMRNKERVC